MKNDLNYAVELIQKADGILITAGAGMSVDSGLPDFRSVGDSRAYLIHKEGKWQQITEDYSVLSEILDAVKNSDDYSTIYDDLIILTLKFC